MRSRQRKNRMTRKIISTRKAPQAIGTYSQAVQANNTVYISGQIGLDPQTMTLVDGGFAAQTRQMLLNLTAICEEAGGSLQNIAKLTVYLLDMNQFAKLNTIFDELLPLPYPARAVVEVKGLPRGAEVEVDAVMVL